MSTFLTVLPFYTPPEHVRKDVLNKWLDTTRQWDILYGKFLHNHIAHNWIVLAAVVSEDKVEEKMKWWHETYIAHDIAGYTLEPARQITSTMPTITSSNWEQFITYSPVNYPSYLNYFDEVIREKGYVAVVRKHLPRLTAGLSGSALHPLIHLGLGLEAGHDAIIAEGLACMCVAYGPLSLLPSVSDDSESVDQFYTTTAGTGTSSGSPPGALGIIDSSLAFIKTATSPSKDLPAIAKAAAHLPSIQAYGMGEFGGRMLAFDEPSLPLGSSLNDLLPLLFPLSQGEHAPTTTTTPGAEGVDVFDADLGPALTEATALIAAAYLASDNEFFVIHGATSLYSLIVTMLYLSPHQRRLALVYWWKACMAVLVAENFPGVDKLGRILGQWREGRHVALVMREDGVADVVDTTTTEEGNEAGAKLLVTPVGGSREDVREEEEEEEWWKRALERSSCSTDEHASKGVYVMWRWSLWPGTPVQSKTLFKQVAANQIRVPGRAPVISMQNSSEEDNVGDNDSGVTSGGPPPGSAIHLPNQNIWFSG